MADRICAALDVGSNTIRTLVARVDGSRVEALLDLSDFVRLGKGVDKSGELDGERMKEAIRAISKHLEKARDRGAEDVWAVATSAVRDARNGREFVERVHRRAGLQVEIVTGDREAELTYRGAASGIDLSGGAVVVDLGGGSSEIIDADADGLQWAQSLALGSGRLTERFVESDPPTEDELERVATEVEVTLSQLPPARAGRAIFTGGTATHVARLMGRDGEIVHVTRSELGGVRHLLETKTAYAFSVENGIKLERAQVLPAGVRALEAIADHYGVGGIVITRHGIREGILLEHCLEK